MVNMKWLDILLDPKEKNRMKIAITGGTGLLGKYFISLLKLQGIHTPFVISRHKHGEYMGIEARNTDYSIEDITEILKDIDAVVHLAAQRGNYSQFKDYQGNIQITQNLYEACASCKINNIVYASTISVYSDSYKLPWNEDQIPRPASMYGISKLNGELIGDLYLKKYNMHIKSLRFAHLFGCNEKNEYMINKFMRQAFNREKLILFSKQTARREFLYAKDAAEALLYAIEAKDIFGTFNIGSGEALTNQEVAEKINIAFNNHGNLIIEEKNERLIEPSYMNNLKAYEELGFKANYSFLEAMQEIYEEMLNV
jgi:UDP-glucose 4-epimerase